MESYAGKRVLVTGGLGFIGSNLAIRLVELGSKVTIVDPCIPGCGGNVHNISSISRDVRLEKIDISQTDTIRPLLKRVEVIFNLAGEISHRHSMDYPDRDLDLNARAQMLFVRECARHLPGVRIVYSGTRQVYGRPEYLPVDEAHPIAPVDYNGVSKHAAEQYHLMLTRDGLLDAVVARLTNTYGPRLAVNVPCQGVLSVFIMRLLLGVPIEIFGDGAQLRDPIYVDDAVDAMLRIGAAKKLTARVFNVGGPRALPLGEIAATLCRRYGAPAPVHLPFPRELSRIDIGSFASDCTRIRRELKWQPATDLEQGAARTFEFFQQHRADYLDPARGYPECQLQQPSVTDKAPAIA
jgi:UDP-glucose 4-epimerase